jgi:hypothetical protein
VLLEVLADKAVGILVQAAFPGGIRMREVDAGIKVTRHAFVVDELPAILTGDGMHPVDVQRQTDGLCGLVKYAADNRIQ